MEEDDDMRRVSGDVAKYEVITCKRGMENPGDSKSPWNINIVGIRGIRIRYGNIFFPSCTTPSRKYVAAR